MTKADLKRRLKPGTKLRCIKNWRGPCDYPRTVVQVRAEEIVLKTEGGLDSYLGLGRGITIKEFEGGFIVIDPNYDGQLVYRWLTEADNALLGD